MQNSSMPDSAVAEFLSECDEILLRVSTGLQRLERGEFSHQLIDGIYRDMHTMKGSALLFGFLPIGSISHALEASLEPIRRLNRPASAHLVDICLQGVDLVDRIVKAMRDGRNQSEFAEEVRAWVPRLADVASSEFGGELGVGRDAALNFEEQPAAARSAPIQGLKKEKGERMANTEQKPLPPASERPPEAPVTAPAEENKEGQAAANLAEGSVRVQISLLDRLMNLVGELVLVRNQVLQYASSHEELDFLNLSKSLDVVTSDLQGEVMRTRMQPIGNVLSKFQRVIRDLSRELGKKIDITLQGTETELDKTLIEAIKDPLTHIIRNSCDHGIEEPAERRVAGKPENGHIFVRAFHEGGQVVVEVSDDGRGLDREKIIKKCLEKGILPPEKAGKLSEREAFNLIFLPGFSTAKQVTSVSGRGVGMDVVKTNIEKIGGSVELISVLGKGTTLRLKIPLTLAIVPAMLIRCGGQRFAIPQIKLVELVRIEGGSDADRVEILQGRPVFLLRGDLLPLVDLREVLQQRQPGEELAFGEGANIVVLNAEGQIFGLIVDEILDTADIVVKPLSSFLNGLSIFSGATVMGDGSVALILDVVGVAEASHIDTKKGRSDDVINDVVTGKKPQNADAQEFLLFRLTSTAVHAVPLCLVHRLEEFPVSALERSGDQTVIKYRGAILPLIVLDRFLGYEREGSLDYGTGRVSVIVVQKTGRSYGLVVREIHDIVYVEDQIDDSVRDRAGVLGNVIQQEKIIVVVDSLGIVESEVGRLKGPSVTERSAIEEIRARNKDLKQKKVRVLFAEDVGFFRKQVSKVLTQQGFDVTVAEDGAEALKVLNSFPPDQFNLILSDIEMPNLNGYDFVREVRKSPGFQKIPIIALTTKFKQKDIDEGMAAGFNLYLEKLNPDKLLRGIESLISG